MTNRGWLRWLALSSGCLTALASGGCSGGRSAKPSAPPAPAPVAVLGTLREGYTGRPITSGEVVLGHYAQGVTFKITLATRPDAGGRFRFDRVPTPELLSLRWKPDETAKKTVLGIEPHRLGEDNLQDTRANPGWGDSVYVDVGKAAGKDVDVGTVNVWFQRAAQELFAPVCETGRPSVVVPVGTGVVVLWQLGPKDSFSLAEFWHQDVAAAWPAAWKGVTCITATEKKLGTYSQFEISGGSTAAYNVTWKVRVIRLPDGKTFRTTISADPPRQIQVDSQGQPVDRLDRDVKGDPRPRLREWLASLAT